MKNQFISCKNNFQENLIVFQKSYCFLKIAMFCLIWLLPYKGEYLLEKIQLPGVTKLGRILFPLVTTFLVVKQAQHPGSDKLTD